jgi:hypothetical protein
VETVVCVLAIRRDATPPDGKTRLWPIEGAVGVAAPGELEVSAVALNGAGVPIASSRGDRLPLTLCVDP